MNSLGDKTLVFYTFQLAQSKDYNVTWLPQKKEPAIVRDILSVLPMDLSSGTYHFRFKSEVKEGDQKVTAWLDINNLGAKAPVINNAIYVKILELKDHRHNKLFHVDKLIKAGIVQSYKPSPSTEPTMPKQDAKPQVPSPKPVNQPIPQAPQKATPAPPPKPAANNPQRTPPAPAPPPVNLPVGGRSSNHDNFIDFEPQPGPVNVPSSPPKPAVHATTEENLQTFKDQFKEEQENRNNEKVAQQQLEQKIRLWGYSHNKKINNTTTLLATLHEIWPEWEAVSLTDMLQPEQANAVFRKAVIKVHPDKNRKRHFMEKYLSKRVFELLHESRKQ